MPSDEIDELVAAFAALPGAAVSRGPRHPTAPDEQLTPALTEYFAAFPDLSADPGYVEFMWRYGALSRSDPKDTELFDVFGFGEAAAELDEATDGPRVDPNGFFVFAQSVVNDPERNDMWEYDFAFSLAGHRPPGIYRLASTRTTLDQPFTPHTPDFRAFLRDAVATGGVWPRPDLP